MILCVPGTLHGKLFPKSFPSTGFGRQFVRLTGARYNVTYWLRGPCSKWGVEKIAAKRIQKEPSYSGFTLWRYRQISPGLDVSSVVSYCQHKHLRDSELLQTVLSAVQAGKQFEGRQVYHQSMMTLQSVWKMHSIKTMGFKIFLLQNQHLLIVSVNFCEVPLCVVLRLKFLKCLRWGLSSLLATIAAMGKAVLHNL